MLCSKLKWATNLVIVNLIPVLGVDDTAINKTNIPILLELTF